MQKKKSYILWLPSWYPNKLGPFNGDFIQRHARAVSLYHELHVLFVMRDEKGAVTKDVLTENFSSGNISEQLIYYAVRKAPASIQKAVSQRRYYQLSKKAIQHHILQYGPPQLVHVHITLKAGLIALWLKKKYGIPYVLTEHWTVFLPEAEMGFKQLPFYLRAACKQIWNAAHSISAVSHYLYEHLKKLSPRKTIYVIPNVVDTTIFQPKLFKNHIAPTTFIHISGLNYQKNPEAILKAFAQVKEKEVPFQFHIVGPQVPSLLRLVKELYLDDMVFFHPEVPQPTLAQQMQYSHALILYSRYETFGCVVIEANACGLPVLASDIPAMKERVRECENGVLVPSENIPALAEKIIWFIQNRSSFNSTNIAQMAQEHYNYKVVGQQFDKWYRSVLNANS